jgi:hypothetical protein
MGACAVPLLSLLLSGPGWSSLGYEHCDARLWHLGRSLVTSLAWGNPVRYLVPEPPSLRCLALSRRVRFTNRFTETVLDVCLRTHSTGVSARDLSHRPSVAGTLRPPGKRAVCQPEKRKVDSSILSLTTTHGLVVSALASVDASQALDACNCRVTLAARA